ncbi:PEP-CTERM sorting domain-containing protein [Pontiella sulfatireligans]|uniref:Ice-binding protein C-terminal domain-containing protein n=1 Tax=Pontiella sulfatireligans TaxID=2750658 RepID=A0A6C2UIJ0_9BACT|nr:PEP-CTERM sorting domain-containing protein [Pontiella sulfatireligans]VGO19693.1 hypothetical protein SCARR_01752 [Pontiella sulfatireligans]
MKSLIYCFFIAGLVGGGTVSAQEWVYLSEGEDLTITGPEPMLEVSGIVVCSGMAFDYGNRLYISNGGSVRCLGSMDVNGTVSTGVDYDWLYSYASVSGAESSLEVGGDLKLWSYDLPGRTLGTWEPWGVPCHMEISGGAEVSVVGDISIVNSTLELGSEGTLTVGADLDASMNGTLKMALGGIDRGTESHRLTVTGLATLGGTLDLVFLDGFTAAYGDTFDLFNWDGGVSDKFANISAIGLAEGLSWDKSNLYTTGQLSVIPEPATLSLMGLASSGMYCFRRMRRRKLAGQSLLPVRQFSMDLFFEEQAYVAEASLGKRAWLFAVERSVVFTNRFFYWKKQQSIRFFDALIAWDEWVDLSGRKVAWKAKKRTCKAKVLNHLDALLDRIMK